MDFDKRLQNAIDRGKNRGQAEADAKREEKLSQEELKNRHTVFRLKLSEHIEEGLKKLCEHFPGFEYEMIYGERGWGGSLSRDDLNRGGSYFSRVEMMVRPMNEFNVVNIIGKGTVSNKEIYSWNQFEDISTASLESFTQIIDSWVVMYAEKFASR